MLALAARLNAVLAVSLGWCLMVVAPALVLLAPPLAIAEVAEPREVLFWSIVLGLGSWWLRYTMAALAPASWRVGLYFPGAKPVPTMRRVWVAPGQGIQAYALGGLFPAVVLSEQALELPPGERGWLLAHEQSHIRNGDTRAGLWWLTGIRVLRGGQRTLNGLYRFTRRIPLVGRVFGLYAWLAQLAVRLSLWLFRAIDAHVGRGMEYRADRDAGRETDPRFGAALLSSLSRPLEPSWGLYASHPPTRARIERLSRQAEEVP